MSASPYKSEDYDTFVGSESTQDTTVTPSRVLGRIKSDASLPDPEQDWIVSRVVGGDREVFDKQEGHRTYQGGDIPVVFYDGWPIVWALGSESVQADTAIDHASTSATSTGVTTTAQTGTDLHTITAKMDDKPPSATIESNLYGRGGGSDFVRTFGGCVPNSAEFSLSNDDELQMNAEAWAQSVTPGSSPTTGISVQGYDPWKFDDAESNLALFGSQFARIVDWTFSIENNLTEGRYIEDTEGIDPFELLYGNIDYSASPEIRVTDDSIYQELVNATAGGFDHIAQFTRPNGDTVRFEASGCNIEDAPHDIPEGSEPIDVEVGMQPESITIYIEDSNTSGAYF